MNKFLASATLAFTFVAHATQDLHPAEASLIKLLEKAQKQDSRCNSAYTEKLLKLDSTSPGNGEEFQNAKDANELLKMLKGGRSADAKVSDEIISLLTKKTQELRGEKVMGPLFSATACRTFAEYNVLRRLMLNSKLGKKGFPTAKDIKPRFFEYLKRGSELDSMMTLLQVALVRTATESNIIKISPELLKSFADLSNTVGAARKKNSALESEVWNKGVAKNPDKPDEKELPAEELNKLLGFEIEHLREMQPIRKDYVALVIKLKAQNL